MFVLLMCGLTLGLAFGVTTGEKIKTEGLIVSRQHDSLTVRTAKAGDVVLILTDYTKVVMPQGWLGKKPMSSSNLVPGLWVKVQGVGNSPGQVLAEQVSFSRNDLRTASAIQAGLTPLDVRVQANQQQIQANALSIQSHQQQIQLNQQDIRSNQQGVQQLNQRFSDLSDYEVRYTALVYFPVGSSALSPQDRNQLMQVAKNALNLKGYLLEVRGYTDSSGHAAMNQDLSRRRADSVIAFLEQEGNVSLTHILAPGAMGEARPAASNESPQGRAENRRAEIRVLINRGLSGN
jgi:outer membrane protein OmpA-like peptidoglycan-associated protein